MQWRTETSLAKDRFNQPNRQEELKGSKKFINLLKSSSAVLGSVGKYLPITQAVQKENYTTFNTVSQVIFREIRRDFYFPSISISGFLLQINIMCLRLCCSLSLLPNWFSRSVLIQHITEFLLWHDRTWNVAGQALHSYFQQLVRTTHFIPLTSLRNLSAHTECKWIKLISAYLLKVSILCIHPTRERNWAVGNKQLKPH